MCQYWETASYNAENQLDLKISNKLASNSHKKCRYILILPYFQFHPGSTLIMCFITEWLRFFTTSPSIVAELRIPIVPWGRGVSGLNPSRSHHHQSSSSCSIVRNSPLPTINNHYSPLLTTIILPSSSPSSSSSSSSSSLDYLHF